MIKYFLQRANGVFVKNTLWMTLGLASRLGLQIAYFIIIARTLKPESYGAFSGSLALVSVLTPFVSWGSGHILIKQVSRQPDNFPVYWGMALSVTVLFAFILSAFSIGIGTYVLSRQIAWTIVLPLAIAEFFGGGLSTLSSQAFMAHQILSKASLILIINGIIRFLGALILIALPTPKTADLWAIIYMSTSLLSGLINLFWVKFELGWGPIGIKKMYTLWKEGFLFAIGISAQGAYNDVDKTLLVRLADSSIAGIYTATYRIMDTAFLPIRAMVQAAYPRFFIAGNRGIKESLRFSLHLLPWAIVWGLLIGLGLPLFAPLLPIILGPEYSMSSEILIWLAPIPLFRAFSYLAADGLTGSGYQGLRSIIQILIATLNIGLNFLWIPRHGWLGAAWSSLICDGMLALILWGTNIFLSLQKNDKF